jgi:hypothetical protein
MVPQAGAVTPVGQVTVHVTTVSVDPVTKEANSWVVLVITLTDVGEIAKVTVDEGVPPPPPQPSAPSASARTIVEQSFHRLIPVLPRKLDVRSSSTGFSLCPS